MQGELCARRGPRWRRNLLLWGLCVLAVLWVFPVRPGVVLGESMSPTFHSGQVFLLLRLGKDKAVRPGDVLVLDIGGRVYLKRVYALEGDTVWGVDSVEVEGAPDAVVSPCEVQAVRRLARRSAGVGRVVHMSVPAGHVFVLGDAASRSYDSRHFGPVPLGAIRGRVVAARLFDLWRPVQPAQTLAAAQERGAPPVR